jgi:hypothetical protein
MRSVIHKTRSVIERSSQAWGQRGGYALEGLACGQLDVPEDRIFSATDLVLHQAGARRAVKLAKLDEAIDETARITDQHVRRLYGKVHAVTVKLVVLGRGAYGLTTSRAGEPVLTVTEC